MTPVDPAVRRRRGLITIVVMMATIMHALDGTIANVALPSIQGSLSATQEQVSPGGLLVYAVCSVDPEEGQDQVEMFLRSHPAFTTEPPKGLSALPTWQGHLRTLPGPEGLDGFFAARLRKMY